MKIERIIGGLVLLAAITLPTLGEAQRTSSGPEISIVPFGDTTAFIPVDGWGGIASASHQWTAPSFGNLLATTGGLTYTPGAEFWLRGSDSFEVTENQPVPVTWQVFILAEHEGTLNHQESFSTSVLSTPPWEVEDAGYLALVDSPVFNSRVMEFTLGANESPTLKIRAAGGGGNSGTRVTLDTDPDPNSDPTKSGIADFDLAGGYDDTGQLLWCIAVRSFMDNQELILQMRGEALVQSGSVVATPWTPLPQDITRVRFHWWPSSAASAGDGGILLSHGNTPVARATGLHISATDLDEVQVGILDPVAELGGNFSVDNFSLVTDVEPPELVPLFADGGETGDLGNWVGTPSSLIQVTTAAAHSGQQGIAFDFGEAGNSLYLIDDSPQGERHLRIRFDIDPSNLVHPNGNSFSALTAWDAGQPGALLRARLVESAGDYFLQMLAWDDAGTARSLPWVNIATNTWSDLEIQWWAASSSGAGDGGMRLWVNGELKEERTNLLNSSYRIDHLDIGARGLDAGTSGILHLDNYQSRY